MLKKLSDTQIALMDEVRDDWLSLVFGERKKINREEMTPLIHWLYEFSGFKKPLVIYLESPAGLQIAANIFRGSQVRNQVWDQVWSQVWSQVWNQVWDQVWDQVRSQVEDQVESQVRNQVWSQVESQVRSQVWSQVRNQVENQAWSQVWSQVRNQVRSQVESQVRNQVEDQVESQVRNQELAYFSFASHGNIWDLSWLSFYDFFERIGFTYNNEAYTKFKTLMKSGIYDMIQLDKVCLVASLPSVILRDERNNLHSVKEPAISWEDGYALWFLHGVAFEKKLWKKIVSKTITTKEVLALKNIEQRMAALKVIGVEKILEGQQVVDRLDRNLAGNSDYELYLVKNVFSQDAYYLKYSCTSTGRVYVTGIEPKIGKKHSALEAIAWKFGIDDFEEGKPLFTLES